MKKVLSIFLLVVALFNLGGYGLFMAHLEDGAVEKLDRQLDNETVSASRLVSIKIPMVNLPYYTNSQMYERRYGKIEIGGAVYNFFEQRIYNDSLEVICVLDSVATSLHDLSSVLFKINNDLMQGTQGKKKGAGTGVFKFFSPGNCPVKSLSKKYSSYLSASGKSNRATLILPFYYVSAIEDPPEA